MQLGTDVDGVYRAIADPTRRRILDLLAQRDLPVGDMVGQFAISQPAVSQHLRVLREVGLVSPQRAGRRQVYRLHAEALAEVYDWLAHYEGFWSERFARLSGYLDDLAEREGGAGEAGRAAGRHLPTHPDAEEQP